MSERQQSVSADWQKALFCVSLECVECVFPWVYSMAVLVISPGLNIDCPQAISISEEKYWLK
jgi:hypothetical protein